FSTLSFFLIPSYKNSHKHSVCVNMLHEGYHKSFSELFALIQKWNTSREAAGPGSAIWQEEPLEKQPDKLDQLQHFLTRAEAAQRAGQDAGGSQQTLHMLLSGAWGKKRLAAVATKKVNPSTTANPGSITGKSGAPASLPLVVVETEAAPAALLMTAKEPIKSRNSEESKFARCMYVPQTIYNNRGQYDKRYKYFEMASTIAINLGDLQLLEKAQVYIGKAHQMTTFSSHIEATGQVNTERVLAWKDSRNDMFSDPSALCKSLVTKHISAAHFLMGRVFFVFLPF
ncbi:TTC29 protein, partial [Polyodon spathula]|nr:TTC29 protein [Polyodon spathula]